MAICFIWHYRFSHITKGEDGNWAWLGMGKMMTRALVEEGALTALASIADSSEVLYVANILHSNDNAFKFYT